MARKRPTTSTSASVNAEWLTFKIKSHPLSQRQKEFLHLSLSEDVSVIFVSGPAGSTKTYMAVLAALREVQKNAEKNLIYVRTVIESADRNLGYLPGDVEEKFNPYMAPLRDKLDEIISPSQSPSVLSDLLHKGRIQAMPINYLRGASLNDSIVIADEAQNFTFKELTTLITRIGKNTKLFICGDLMQSDINGRSGFREMIKLFQDAESEERGINCFEFFEEDIRRSEILKFIIKRLYKKECKKS